MAVELLPKILPNILFRTLSNVAGTVFTPLFRYKAGDPLPAGAAFTGPAGRTYLDVNGVMQTAGLNVLRDGHYIGGVRTVLLEGARTNHFLNSAAPVTQTTPALATGTYTVWLTGSGSVTVSAGTATITGAGAAVAGTPVTFTVTVTGTVTYTVAGGPTLVQAELGTFPSSYIATTGAAVTRTAELLTFTYAPLPQSLTLFVKAVNLGTAQLSGQRYIQIGNSAARLILSAVSGGTDFNSTTPASDSLNVAIPALNSTVELSCLVRATGAVRLSQSVNGGAELISPDGSAGAFAAAYGSASFAINSGAGGTFVGNEGFAAFQSVKIAAGAHSLAEMRSY